MKHETIIRAVMLSVALAALLCAAALAENYVEIDATNFPDYDFRYYVSENFDEDGDGRLSDEERDQVTEIDVDYCEIASLEGIAHFANLKCLICYKNQLTTLDVSHNTTLEKLECSNNQLASLDVSHNAALKELDCYDNQLTTLDVSHNAALKTLFCGNNQLSILDVSHNVALGTLFCENNQLTTLDVSHNSTLYCFECQGNQLTTLDVSHNSALHIFYCSNNQLSTLDVSQNPKLFEFACENNQITALYVCHDAALHTLDCSDNQLTTLDVSDAIELRSLNCVNNQLTTLNLGIKPEMEYLRCQQNRLTTMDISNCPHVVQAYIVETPTDVGYLQYGYNLSIDYDVNITYDNPQGELIPLNGTVFLDANFEACLAEYDCDGDGALSEAEVATVRDLDVRGQGISSLTGIDRFTRLRDLNCSDNLLTTLDLRANKELYKLRCGSNQLTSLRFDPDNMCYLYCQNNQLTELDLSQCTWLEELDCRDNLIQSLDFRHLPYFIMLYTEKYCHVDGEYVHFYDESDYHGLYCDVDVTLNNGVPLLTVLSLPSNLNVIDANAFDNIAAGFVEAKNVDRIESGAFANCAGLYVVDIQYANYIADDAFSGCDNVVFFTYSKYVADWAEAHGYICMNWFGFL